MGERGEYSRVAIGAALVGVGRCGVASSRRLVDVNLDARAAGCTLRCPDRPVVFVGDVREQNADEQRSQRSQREREALHGTPSVIVIVLLPVMIGTRHYRIWLDRLLYCPFSGNTYTRTTDKDRASI